MGKENGRKIQVQAQIHMKATITQTKSMDRGYLGGRVEMCTVVSTKMMKEKVMVRCNGLMGQCIKVIGREEYNMEREE